MINLPPEPAPPTHTRAAADVRWLTDLGVVYFRQHQFGEAYLCFSRAAEQGFAAAQFCLAVCYFNGQGTAQDEAAAIPWLREAAAQGDGNAEFTLGLAYRLGRGLKRDSLLADQWLRKAAAHGHPEAIRRIEEMPGEGNVRNIISPVPTSPPVPPAPAPPSERNPTKPRHDLQRLILGVFKKQK
jgi:TPR repeat protein